MIGLRKKMGLTEGQGWVRNERLVRNVPELFQKKERRTAAK